MVKKILVLLADGVGLKNFIYTDFLLDKDNVKVWTPLEYLPKYVDTVKLPNYNDNKLSDIYKNALIKANLLYFHKKYNDEAYLSYIFPSSSKEFKQRVKKIIINTLAYLFSNQKGVSFLRDKYLKNIRKSSNYEACIMQLKEYKPDFIFCTHQRTSVATAPILAAQSLGIPTATFIFSWDNLPKGNLTVPAEHLFVWSHYMKDEVVKYYPYIQEKNIHVVGTPQFIPYTNKKFYESREVFCKKYNFDIDAKIICFSGDDVTTSPYDPIYLEDTAKAIEKLNKETNEKYQILFRRCPVDISGRYNKVIEKYSDIIRAVEPLWEAAKNAATWNEIIPTLEDVKLLVNTVLHSETAINVGSTIAHDFASFHKTSCYLKYNVSENNDWDIFKVYKFIHFRSMEGLSPIYWIEDREAIGKVIIDAIEDKENKQHDMQQWFSKIARHPLSMPNKNIWEAIDMLLE